MSQNAREERKVNQLAQEMFLKGLKVCRAAANYRGIELCYYIIVLRWNKRSIIQMDEELLAITLEDSNQIVTKKFPLLLSKRILPCFDYHRVPVRCPTLLFIFYKNQGDLDRGDILLCFEPEHVVYSFVAEVPSPCMKTMGVAIKCELLKSFSVLWMALKM